MIEFHTFCQYCKKELLKVLPGKEYQERMAFPHRNAVIAHGYPAKKSGVLLLLYPFKRDIGITLIKRTDSGCVHSGQIAFPGGQYEDTDTTLINTALREAHEEIGVLPEDVHLLGPLTSLFIPVSNFLVFPHVGYLLFRPVFIPNPTEVHSVLEFSLKKLMSPSIQSHLRIPYNNRSVDAPCIRIEGHTIWGATAMILSELFEILHRIGYE